ncbi:MAG: hypothetical protein OXH92_14565 [Bryobacterales bacterium]|nr:hypothetical protein [Bryobacterales bacterium]
MKPAARANVEKNVSPLSGKLITKPKEGAVAGIRSAIQKLAFDIGFFDLFETDALTHAIIYADKHDNHESPVTA